MNSVCDITSQLLMIEDDVNIEDDFFLNFHSKFSLCGLDRKKISENLVSFLLYEVLALKRF